MTSGMKKLEDYIVITSRLAVIVARTADLPLASLALKIRRLSRASFAGWASSHRSRIWEYPWVIREVTRGSASGSPVAIDIGAGRSPVPIALRHLGMRTIVVDPGPGSEKDRGATGKEWEWTDYTKFGVETQRTTMEDMVIAPGTVGFAVSVSVIEHLPAQSRRAGIARVADALRPGGHFIVTVDLARGTDALFNMAAGAAVESADEHGKLGDLLSEVAAVGLRLERLCRSPLSVGACDVVGISFRKPASESMTSSPKLGADS